MKKTELKDLVKETINEVREEQATNKILRESLDHDVKTLQEYREAHSGFIAEGVLTESQVDEGFFDTVKNLGKNVAGSVAAAGKSAVNAVGAAWKKAKAQGDEDEAKRLEKKLQALRGGNASKKPLKPGDHGYTAAYAKSIGKKVASKQGNAANPQGGQPAAPAADKKKAANTADKKKAAVQATKEIIKKMAKDDPKGLEQLKQYAKDPKKLEQLTKNPKIQQAGQKAKAEIAKEDKPGLFAKVAMWATENPVKASIGIGAITALAGALALPAAGPAALLMAGLQAAGINLATVSTLKQLARSSGVKGIKEESDVDSLDEELDGKIEEIDSRNRSK